MSESSPSVAAVAFVGRGDLRRRWRTVVLVGLLFGLAGGIGIASLAGARRTATVFERHLVATNAPEIEVDPGAVTPEADRALRSLPHVTGASYWVTFSVFPLEADGSIDRELGQALAFTTDGRYLREDRVVTTSGRLLDPTKADEVMVNQSYADAAQLKVGSTIPMAIVEVDEDGEPVSSDPPEVRLMMKVVGIMVLNEEITSEDIDTIPRVFVSPAARREPVGDPRYYGFSWYGLQVAGGPSAVEEVEQRWQALADRHNATMDEEESAFGGWLTYVRRSSDLQRKASRASRPLVTTLASFGLLVLLASIALVSQSLGRDVRSRRNEAVVTRVLGFTPMQALGASLVVPAAALAVSVVIAAVTAVGLSVLFPVGPFSVLEPSEGLTVDVPVLLPALAILLAAPLLLVSFSAWREVRTSSLTGGEENRAPGRLVRLASRTGRWPSLSAAVRLTFDPGRGRLFVPTRSMLVSITVTVFAMVTILEFGGTLAALDRDPSRFGWTADAVSLSDGGYGPFDQAKLDALLDSIPEVTSRRSVGVGQVQIGGWRVPSAVFGPGDPDFAPPLISGRAPSRQGEIVLGARTMRRLDTAIGRRVSVGTGSDRESMLVTGTAVFPVLGPVLSTRTGLDEGAWLNLRDYRQLDTIAAFISYGMPDGPHYSTVLLGLKPHTSIAVLSRKINAGGASLGSSIDVGGVIRPSEVRTAAAGGGRSQLLLASVLAAAAGAFTLLALAAVVRRRRGELAVYRVLGFRPRQVRATLLWQGFIMAALSVAVGTPLGIALGRSLWRAFATRLGVVPDPMIPWGPIGMAAVLTIVVGMLGALGPAIAASRVPPAVGVRAE